MKFDSKIYWWMHLIFVLLAIYPLGIIPLVFLVNNLAVRIVLGLSIAAVFALNLVIIALPMWKKSYCLVNEDELIIRRGFLINKIIQRKNIISINEELDFIKITCTKKKAKTKLYKVSLNNRQEFVRMFAKAAEI